MTPIHLAHRLACGLLVAGVLAVSVAAGGGGLSLGGGASTVDSVATNLTRAKSEGKKSARKGNPDGAWRQMKMRTLKRTAKPALECLTHSFGQVRDHFARNPCKSLGRTLFAIGTGDITPLATPLLDLADIHFTGLHYGSRSDGSTVVIAEAETVSGQVSGEVLDVVADVASWLPR